MSRVLDNYRQLTTRIDALCKGIESALGEQITCSEGCSSCCTAITIFPVEAAALREAVDSLDEQTAEFIRKHVDQKASGERCPLLSHNRCLLYAERPIICRTHGLPVIYTENNTTKSDCCPHNMIEIESIDGSMAVDLDKLNTLLVAVNSLYLSQTEAEDIPERLTIAAAINRP